VRLLANRVALKPLLDDDVADMLGLLWLPQSVADSQRYMIAEVVAAGPESGLIPGLRVVHRQFHFVEVDSYLLPEGLRCFWEHDILAILKKGVDGMYTVVPLRNCIVVEEHPPDAYEGTLIMLDDSLEKPLRGTVLAVGPGLPLAEGGRLEMDVAEGDVVCWMKFAGTKLAIDGTEVLILDEDKVLAKLEEQA